MSLGEQHWSTSLILYGLGLLRALQVRAAAHGLDDLGRQRPPRLAAGVEQVVVVAVRPVAQVVAPQVVPQVLHRVQRRCSRV